MHGLIRRWKRWIMNKMKIKIFSLKNDVDSSHDPPISYVKVLKSEWENIINNGLDFREYIHTIY